MVSRDRMKNLFAGFAVPLREFRTDLRMTTFHLMVRGFADVVQQRTSSRELGVQSEFGRHHATQVRHLQTVL